MITKIPEEVLIGCIAYRIVEVEGMIVFSEAQGMYGCCDRMIFTHPEFGLWQLDLKTTFGTISASHVCKAFEFVQEWRGDNFGREVNKNE